MRFSWLRFFIAKWTEFSLADVRSTHGRADEFDRLSKHDRVIKMSA